MADERRGSIALAVTGASGAIYAVRTLADLLSRGLHVELVVSDYGRRLLRDELGERSGRRAPDAVSVGEIRIAGERGSFTVLSNRDLGATIASGSHGCTAMAIVPCSMKTLAGIAHGLSRNLIERAADVMLKEHRPLVIVPRETPMSLPALRNMVLCAEAGATVLPAMPAFYQLPKTLDDLADFMAGKIRQRARLRTPAVSRMDGAGGILRFFQRRCCWLAATSNHEDTKATKKSSYKTLFVRLRVLRAFVVRGVSS